MTIKNTLAVLMIGCSLAILSSRTYGQSPVIYYPLDESSGTNAHDVSGNGFNAWTTNTSGPTGSGATWSPASGIIGGALRFTPSVTDYSQAFAFNGSANIITAYPFTIAAWIQTSLVNQNGPYDFLFLGDGTLNSSYYSLLVGGQNQSPAYRAELEARNTTSVDTDSAHSIPDGNWHHIAGVCTSATLRTIYVDGVAISNSTTSVTLVNSIKRLGLGALTRASIGNSFNGYLDDVAVWNVALTPQTIALIHALGSFEHLPLTNSGIATLMGLETAAGGSAYVGVHNWAYSANLSTNVNFTNTIGFTGGTAAAGNGYVVLGASGDGVQMQGIAGPPTINLFSVSPSSMNSYPAGTTIRLSWNVANATSVQIDQGIGVVALTGTNTVTLAVPPVSTTWTLIATNATGSITNQTTLAVNTMPNVTRFVVWPQDIYPGDSTELNWVVANDSGVQIDNGVGALGPASGSVWVTPTNTTSQTYTFIATNSVSGTAVTYTATVTVLPTPAPYMIVAHYNMDEMTNNYMFNSLNTNLYTGVFQDTNEANPSWNSGWLNGGLTFAPTNSANENTAVRASVAGAITNYPFTISAWIDANDQGLGTSAQNELITLRNSAYGDVAWSLTLGQNNYLAIYAQAHNVGPTPYPYSANVGGAGWVHVVLVCDNPYLRKLYVFGQLVTDDPINLVPFSAPDRLSIGDADVTLSPTVPSGFYNGSLDELTLLSGRWQSNDVANIYGIMTGFNLDTVQAEALLEGFRPGGPGCAEAGGLAWQTTTGLSGTVGTTGGDLADTNAYVVMDNAGDGMQVVVAAPLIASSPQSQTNYIGTSTTLSVQACSSLPLTYQWYNGANSMGTNATLVLTNLQTLQAGNYYCSVTNALGGTNSATATLTVIAFPSNQITNTVMLPGGTFQLTATGTSGYTYGVESSSLITGPWTTVTNILVGPSGLIVFQDTNTQPATKFYRTVVTPP